MSGSARDRAAEAWRAWLAALETDADAALAAAMAYEALDGAGRDAWLDALEADAAMVPVPTMALYAPLYAVEESATRRARIEVALRGVPAASAERRALIGGEPSHRVCVVARPLYLAFHEVLVVHYSEARGIDDARHEPLLHLHHLDALAPGAALASVPLADAVDELAHAVVAHARAARPLPDVLRRHASLFDLRADALLGVA